ncbi:MAG: NAD+ synthase [Thermoplasmata archaeon]|nr:NAD+ synthase [Thermoplasmata archaeon]
MEIKIELGQETVPTIKTFISDYLVQSGASGYILGLSGGIDSAVVCKLLVDAVGQNRVAAVLMPSATTSPEDMEDARKFAETLGIEKEEVEIEPIVTSFRKALGFDLSRMHTGNLTARVRMCILFAFANQNNLLVAGTSNKSELLTGYFTKYGDGAADILPIGDLYKTQVRLLAKDLKIQEKILKKVPSAGFWEGQTDEEELGISYEELDRILFGIEHFLKVEEIHAITGIPVEKIAEVVRKVEKSWHKRRLGIIPKVGTQTVGVDWRE